MPDRHKHFNPLSPRGERLKYEFDVTDITIFQSTLPAWGETAGRIYCEDNGDKGYLAKDLRSKGERVVKYHESQNKFIKITSYLKVAWKHVYFVDGTDAEYINQICDYNENAEHDDAPDSCASIIRQMFFKKDSEYKSPFGG